MIDLLNIVDNKTKAYIEENIFSIRADRTTVLTHENNRCSGLIRVVSGKVKVYTLISNSKEYHMFYLEPNDTCIFSMNCVIGHIIEEVYFEIEEDAIIDVLEKKIIENLYNSNPDIKDYINELLMTKTAVALSRYHYLLSYSLEVRLKAIVEDNNKIPHKKLAYLLGSSREVISKLLKKIKNSK